jgi:N-ethylmaleimide reductase
MLGSNHKENIMSVSTTSIAPAVAAQQTPEERLFQPMRLGRYQLPHRVVMAPLTRSRARQPGNVPSPLTACYYAQRASAALIVTEATQVSQQGQGYAWTPGIHSREQIEGWRGVTDAVHEAGGLIFMQLWHVGRISHPALQPDGMLPVAPSDIKPAGQAFIENEMGEGALVPFVTPRALQTEEMPYIVRQYVRGAKNALDAGFDGVEIYAANGYLLDQFINSSTNQRTDWYGGPIENRARLLVEVVEAVAELWRPDRVGVRLSPLGTLIMAGGFDQDTAEAWLEQGRADLIAFGRKFLANPDLPERFCSRATLNADDPSTYYGGGAKGYTDYPTLAQERGEEPKSCVDDRWR